MLIHNKNGKVQVTVTFGVTCTKKVLNAKWLFKSLRWRFVWVVLNDTKVAIKWHGSQNRLSFFAGVVTA